VTELQDALPDALVPAGPFQLPDLRPVDAILLGPRASDASVGAHPDAAADAIVPALAAERCVEKLAVPEQAVQARVAKVHSMQALPEAVAALYIPGAAPSAA
jgi:hypothetical protein